MCGLSEKVGYSVVRAGGVTLMGAWDRDNFPNHQAQKMFGVWPEGKSPFPGHSQKRQWGVGIIIISIHSQAS